MLILGIETATERIGVAIAGSDGVLASFEVTRGRQHAEILMPAIEFVCRHAGIEVASLSACAVDVGPGLFTGMRVGLATAQAMAMALEIPVIGVSSLEVLAQAYRHCHAVVVSIIDARKGQVFYELFLANGLDVRSVDTPRVGTIDDVIARIDDRAQEVICIGDGAVRYRERLEGHRLIEIGEPQFAHPSVQLLAMMAVRRAVREEWTNARDVRAVYLRAPDAEINWSTRTNPSSPSSVNP